MPPRLSNTLAAPGPPLTRKVTGRLGGVDIVDGSSMKSSVYLLRDRAAAGRTGNTPARAV